ncbi:unnamed protein product, partial [Brachionus calyciflorus]
KQDTIVDILDGTARDKIKKLKWGEQRHLAHLLEKSYKASKDAISKIRNSIETEFKTVEELNNFIKTTLESLDEEKSNIHKEAEDKNLQKEFTDDETNFIERLEVANKSSSEVKEVLKTVLENERRSYEMNKNAYQLYYDTTNFDNTLQGNESVEPKNSQQVQFKLDETQLNLQTKQLVTPKYNFGRTASNTFNIKADQYSTPYTLYVSKIDSSSISKSSQSQLINNNLGTNNLVVPKKNKKMDPLTPKFTGSSKKDVENWLFKIEQNSIKH